MSLREEELNLLFRTIDAMIERSHEPEHSVEGFDLDATICKLKQDCINVIAFGESLE